jgi:hypothetical protein
MLLQLSIAILALFPVTINASTFTPSCTTPNESVNFVMGTGFRSTLDILWSCLFTIFACTWTIQHLNVPKQRNGRDPSFLGDLKWTVKRVCKSVKWMLVTIIAPEWIVGTATASLMGALESKRKFKELAVIDGVDWTLEHGFYSNMGAFAIEVKLPKQETTPSQTEKDGVGNFGQKSATMPPSPRALPANGSDAEPSNLSLPSNLPSSVADDIDGKDLPGSDRGALEQDKIAPLKSGESFRISMTYFDICRIPRLLTGHLY